MGSTVAVLGLGTMGRAMAHNLVQAGFSVQVWNRSRARMQGLPFAARAAQTPREAAEGAEFVLTVLTDGAAVAEVATGEEGFLAALPPGSLWIQVSTVSHLDTRRLEGLAAQRGVGFLDAPVSGSRRQAEEASLVFLVGGADEDVRRAEPVLAALGQKAFHLGPPGAGTAAKLAVNLLLALTTAGLAEAVLLAESLGVSRSAFLDALAVTPLASPYVRAKAELLRAGEYPPAFALRLMHKDLTLIRQAARAAAAPSPLGTAAEEMFARAVSAGLGDQDVMAVFSFLARDAAAPSPGT